MIPDAFPRVYQLGLGRADHETLAAHWCRLPAPSLRRRFLRQMDRAALAARAAETLDGRAHLIGWHADGVLRGVAELHPAGARAGEAAFTVEPGWRRRGIGRTLLRRLLRRARNLGLGEVLVITTRDNPAMVRLALGEGARIVADGAELAGLFTLAPPTPVSLGLDIGGELAGLAAALGTRAAVWPDARPAIAGAPPRP